MVLRQVSQQRYAGRYGSCRDDCSGRIHVHAGQEWLSGWVVWVGGWQAGLSWQESEPRQDRHIMSLQRQKELISSFCISFFFYSNNNFLVEQVPDKLLNAVFT